MRKTKLGLRPPLLVALLIIVVSALVVATASATNNGATRRSASKQNGSGYPGKVVAAGLKSKMSRAPLNVGGIKWPGATTSPKPYANGTVAVVPCILVLKVCRYIGDSAKAAATAMGWKTIIVDGKSDPSTEQKGVDAAINSGANCVLSIATTARDIRAQIARGKKKGVKFVTGFADSPRPYGGQSAIGPDYKKAGALLAAYVLTHGGGNIIVFSLPIAPSANDRTAGFVDFLKKYGGNKAKVIHNENFGYADIGPGLQTKTRALLTRYPKGKVQWVIGPFDDAIQVVLQTAKAQGRSEIKGLGFDGTDPAIADIRKGGPEVATINWALDWLAWQGVDECNRALNGSPVGVNKDIPIQLVTKQNAAPPGTGYKLPFDFKKAFAKLWKTGHL